MSWSRFALALVLGAPQEPAPERAPDGPILLGLCARGTATASAEDLALYRGATLVSSW